MTYLSGMATKAKRKIGSTATPAIPPNTKLIPPPFNASEVPSVYSNTLEMLSMNRIDVRMGFNEVLVETGMILKTARRANVVMSVPSFLTMVQIVNAHAQKLLTDQQEEARKAHAHLQAQLEAGIKAGTKA